MIHRIVKLTFKAEYVEDFMNIFADTADKIRSCPGCHSVQLLHDQNDPRVFFTYSLWDKEASLDSYRNSEFFKETWAKVKQIFDDRPKAWTTHMIS